MIEAAIVAVIFALGFGIPVFGIMHVLRQS